MKIAILGQEEAAKYCDSINDNRHLALLCYLFSSKYPKCSIQRTKPHCTFSANRFGTRVAE